MSRSPIRGPRQRGIITDQDCRPLVGPTSRRHRERRHALARPVEPDRHEGRARDRRQRRHILRNRLRILRLRPTPSRTTTRPCRMPAAQRRSSGPVPRTTPSACNSPAGARSITDSTFGDDEFGICDDGRRRPPDGVSQHVRRCPVSTVPRSLGGRRTLDQPARTLQPAGRSTWATTTSTGGSCAVQRRRPATTVRPRLNLAAVAADHGGPTPTVAVSAPSALIDTIPVDATWGPEHKKLCPAGTTDQRGLEPSAGRGLRAGAFEVGRLADSGDSRTEPGGAGHDGQRSRAKITPGTATFHDLDPVAGKVTFKTRYARRLCSGKAVDSSGVATCTTKTLPAGRDVVRAGVHVEVDSPSAALPRKDRHHQVATPVTRLVSGW